MKTLHTFSGGNWRKEEVEVTCVDKKGEIRKKRC